MTYLSLIKLSGVTHKSWCIWRINSSRESRVGNLNKQTKAISLKFGNVLFCQCLFYVYLIADFCLQLYTEKYCIFYIYNFKHLYFVSYYIKHYSPQKQILLDSAHFRVPSWHICPQNMVKYRNTHTCFGLFLFYFIL